MTCSTKVFAAVSLGLLWPSTFAGGSVPLASRATRCILPSSDSFGRHGSAAFQGALQWNLGVLLNVRETTIQGAHEIDFQHYLPPLWCVPFVPCAPLLALVLESCAINNIHGLSMWWWEKSVLRLAQRKFEERLLHIACLRRRRSLHRSLSTHIMLYVVRLGKCTRRPALLE